MRTDFEKVYEGLGSDLKSELQILSGKNIYFGHQSVGANIIDGIETLCSETGTQIEIIETRDFSKINTPAFYHFGIGKNGEPEMKIDDFVQVAKNISADSSALAFFKFCYDDFTETADVDKVFSYYKEQMLKLQNQYPDLHIILFTVPYTALQKGPRAIVKKILSMPLAGELENIKRSEFNTRILAELGSEFPVFDMGRIEATLPNGEEITYSYDETTYPAMAHSYTDDLGHLNAYGSRIMASNLISFLATELTH